MVKYIILKGLIYRCFLCCGFQIRRAEKRVGHFLSPDFKSGGTPSGLETFKMKSFTPLGVPAELQSAV